MIEKRVIGQLVRFTGMGVVNSALYFVLAAVFSEIFGFVALAASVLAYIIAATFAYVGHKFLTFRQPAHAPDEMTRFVAATGMGLSLAALIPILLAGLAPMTSFVTVLVLVPVCSFLMMKFFVFRT
ncbi:GtrA family protein [Aliiroseovarius sediminis]|uniref:GtrA family protein n=1 Tax=Aliiroseovarius sediminis TaxID=2925839 RepID=UPI001F59B031|nr:GtrA family protein [Aliiroseovarius sediminis]MCI2394591.1 GtrA family protein [Aliiroseovarius sediminis]